MTKLLNFLKKIKVIAFILPVLAFILFSYNITPAKAIGFNGYAYGSNMGSYPTSKLQFYYDVSYNPALIVFLCRSKISYYDTIPPTFLNFVKFDGIQFDYEFSDTPDKKALSSYMIYTGGVGTKLFEIQVDESTEQACVVMEFYDFKPDQLNATSTTYFADSNTPSSSISVIDEKVDTSYLLSLISMKGDSGECTSINSEGVFDLQLTPNQTYSLSGAYNNDNIVSGFNELGFDCLNSNTVTQYIYNINKYKEPNEYTIDYIDIDIDTIGITYPEEIYCELGKDCVLPIYYNKRAINSYIQINDSAYLWPDGTIQELTGNQVASTTLINTFDFFSHLTLPSTTTETSITYYAGEIWSDNETEFFNKFKFVVTNHLSTTTYMQQFLEQYDISKACDDMATTTGLIAGIECAFRKLVYWATVPKSETLWKFQTNNNALHHKFPMSVGFQIKDTIDELLSTSSEQMKIALINPMTGKENILIDSNEDFDKTGINKDTWDNFKVKMAYLLWFSGLIYFIFRIYRMNQKSV